MVYFYSFNVFTQHSKPDCQGEGQWTVGRDFQCYRAIQRCPAQHIYAGQMHSKSILTDQVGELTLTFN